MLDVVNFIFSSIIAFINSLRYIILPGTSISIFTFYIGILAISLILSFIRHFFLIEKNMLNTRIDSMYFKRRAELIDNVSYKKSNKQHTTKYLQNNIRRLK